LHSRLAAAYKGIHALLLRRAVRTSGSGQPYELTSFWDERVDIHHIFPRELVQEAADRAGRYDWRVTRRRSRRVPIVIGVSPRWLSEEAQQDAKIADERTRQILKSHLIEPMPCLATTSSISSNTEST